MSVGSAVSFLASSHLSIQVYWQCRRLHKCKFNYLTSVGRPDSAHNGDGWWLPGTSGTGNRRFLDSLSLKVFKSVVRWLPYRARGNKSLITYTNYKVIQQLTQISILRRTWTGLSQVIYNVVWCELTPKEFPVGILTWKDKTPTGTNWVPKGGGGGRSRNLDKYFENLSFNLVKGAQICMMFWVG